MLILCGLLCVLMPLVTQGPSQVVALTLIVAAWSLCSWSHFPAQQARLVAIDPPQAQLLLALNASMLYVGIANGSLLAAKLLPIPGFMGLAIGAVVQLASAAVMLVIGDRMIARAKSRSR